MGKNNTERKIRTLRGFFVDPEGNLRRGVPLLARDENGNEITVNREHNTGNIFPVSTPETPTESDASQTEE